MKPEKHRQHTATNSGGYSDDSITNVSAVSSEQFCVTARNTKSWGAEGCSHTERAPFIQVEWWHMWRLHKLFFFYHKEIVSNILWVLNYIFWGPEKVWKRIWLCARTLLYSTAYTVSNKNLYKQTRWCGASCLLILRAEESFIAWNDIWSPGRTFRDDCSWSVLKVLMREEKQSSDVVAAFWFDVSVPAVDTVQV